MHKTLISVIVPCYNQAQYLDECLQSVLDQTYGNWECIIVNDGSPDHTEEIAMDWTQKDARFKYLHKENGGLSSARNAGIKIAKGEWILALDSDDKIGNKYLELAHQEFNQEYAIIYCRAQFFGDQKGEWILPPHSIKELAVQNTIFCTAFFKKTDWEKVGGYDEKIIYGFEDWDFWIRILNLNPKTYKIPSIAFYYRIKNASMTTVFQSNQNKKKEILNYLYKKHIDFFLENLPPIQTLVLTNRDYRVKNQKIVESKRYKFFNKMLKLFGK